MKQDSRFLKLPAELRNEIYRLVLHFKDPIPTTPRLYKYVALLRVCSQVRKEAGPIFWGENRLYSIMTEDFHTTMPVYRKYLNMVPELIIGYEVSDRRRQFLEGLVDRSEHIDVYACIPKCVERWVCDVLTNRAPVSIMLVPTPDANASFLDRVITAYKAKFNCRMAEVAGLEAPVDSAAIEAMLPAHIHLNWQELNLHARCTHHTPETYELDRWKSVWDIRKELETNDDDFGRAERY